VCCRNADVTFLLCTGCYTYFYGLGRYVLRKFFSCSESRNFLEECTARASPYKPCGSNSIMAEVPSVMRYYTVLIGEKLPTFRRVSVLPSSGLYEEKHAVRSLYIWIFSWPCNVYFWLDSGVDLCSCYKFRAWGREHDNHFLRVGGGGGAEKAPIEICKFAVVSAETGERLLAKHIASVTSGDQVSDAYGHTRTHAHTHTHEREYTWGTRWHNWWGHCAKSGRSRVIEIYHLFNPSAALWPWGRLSL
jgi:hypothetical protein